VFFSIGAGSNGQCLPSRFADGAEWLILIDNDAPDIETVIAHEVAHAYLGHSLADLLSEEETEKQAREQVRAWGFSGKGADF
jgi:predicted Zn-dependent protease